jgi:hypothetical protein
MSDDPHPSEVKDAEIERLKAELNQLHENYTLSLEANQQRREKIEVQDKLITELADALWEVNPDACAQKWVCDLMDRAREAIR